MFRLFFVFFFFNDTATTEIYTLSLHDALPIWAHRAGVDVEVGVELLRLDAEAARLQQPAQRGRDEDRKSTRLNSSHSSISYAVFCLKKKKKQKSLPTAPSAAQAHTITHHDTDC